jgi:hypothetical protein
VDVSCALVASCAKVSAIYGNPFLRFPCGPTEPCLSNHIILHSLTDLATYGSSQLSAYLIETIPLSGGKSTCRSVNGRMRRVSPVPHSRRECFNEYFRKSHYIQTHILQFNSACHAMQPHATGNRGDDRAVTERRTGGRSLPRMMLLRPG